MVFQRINKEATNEALAYSNSDSERRKMTISINKTLKQSDTVQNDVEKPLTIRQRGAIPYLAAAPSIREGCRRARIRTETYYQWIKQPAFEFALKKQREDIFQEALQTLSASVQNAVDSLTGLISTENESLKRAVCNDILGHVFKVRELKEIEERLTALENEMNGIR
jgi:hypothetical protein